MKPDDILIALQDLTDTFTFGGGESKAELDEIIRQSLAFWKD